MKSKWFLEKENLIQFIQIDKLSYEEIGRKYNCSSANIRKIAKIIGIELQPKRKINENETFNKGTINVPIRVCLNCSKEFKVLSHGSKIFCCMECKANYQHVQQYQKIIDGDPSIMRANYIPKHFKPDIIREQNGVCAICGMKPEWNGEPLTFILDHIDGHASNNKRDNLRCICPNCDSQLDTFKSKNRDNKLRGDRYYLRYKKYANMQETILQLQNELNAKQNT